MDQLPIGVHKVKIVNHSLQTFADKDAFVLNCENDDGECRVVGYITPKSAGIARASLKLCGFDFDKFKLSDLATKPTLLAGKEITVIQEEFNGKLRAQIQLNATPDKARMSALDSMLRDAKKSNAKDDDDLPF